MEESTNQAREQGLEQVLERGSHQEAFLLVMRLLKRKLGEIPSEIETELANLSTANLENLAEELLDFNNLQELQNWLNNQYI